MKRKKKESDLPFGVSEISQKQSQQKSEFIFYLYVNIIISARKLTTLLQAVPIKNNSRQQGARELDTWTYFSNELLSVFYLNRKYRFNENCKDEDI